MSTEFRFYLIGDPWGNYGASVLKSSSFEASESTCSEMQDKHANNRHRLKMQVPVADLKFRHRDEESKGSRLLTPGNYWILR
jgi:hypothetical protein